MRLLSASASIARVTRRTPTFLRPISLPPAHRLRRRRCFARSRSRCSDASRNGMPARAFRPSAPTGLPARAAWAKACVYGSPSANSPAVSRRSTRPAPWCCACPTATSRPSPLAMCSRARRRLPIRRVDRNTQMVRPSDELVFAPLGGVGEIGMNLAVYGFGDEHRRQWIAVDFGVAFADDALPGVDLIMPDIGYLEEERRNLLGIVLTHAHEDHFGALIDLWPKLKLPVFATPFTAALLQAKRESEPRAPEIPVNIVPLGGRFTLGPFDIELVSMAHSIPESNGLIIRTPLGAVLHTGDWKIDPTPVIGPPTDEAKLRALGDEGCLALIGDSTNAVREGRSPSEADVAKCLADLIRTAPARVAVTTFASNVARLRAVAEAAAKCQREVVVVGRAMDRIAQVARETGYLDGIQEFRSVDVYGHLPPDKVLALCTGSQGEPRAALSRIAQDDHPEVAFSRGDRVIFSSRAIPGNEKAVMRVINGLASQGIEVITDRTHLVHVSGHPRTEDRKSVV